VWSWSREIIRNRERQGIRIDDAMQAANTKRG